MTGQLKTVVVSISNVCNFACPQCPYRPPEVAQFMEDAVFARLATDAASLGVVRIRFLGLNEPTLHPRLSSFLDLARELGLETHLISNGSFVLQSRRREAMLSSLPSEIEVSIDAFDWETYQQVRGRDRAEFQRLTASVAAFFDEISDRNCRRTVSFVLHSAHEAEFEAFERFWALRADRVRARVAHSFSGRLEGGFEVPSFPTPENCAFIETRIFVDVDGRISSCNLDSAGLHVLAHCRDRGGLGSAWMASKRETLLGSFRTGNLDAQCSKCSRCAGLP